MAHPFGNDIKPLESLPKAPKEFKVEPKIKLKVKSPKVKRRYLVAYLESELSQLDKEWYHYCQEYYSNLAIEDIDDDETTIVALGENLTEDSETAFETMRYIEAKIEALIELGKHFGVDPSDLYSSIPNLMKFGDSVLSYQGVPPGGIFSEEEYADEIRKSIKA